MSLLQFILEQGGNNASGFKLHIKQKGQPWLSLSLLPCMAMCAQGVAG
jgi:hypothetical protein